MASRLGRERSSAIEKPSFLQLFEAEDAGYITLELYFPLNSSQLDRCVSLFLGANLEKEQHIFKENLNYRELANSFEKLN